MNTGELYERFAVVEARGQSDVYEDWALAVSASPEMAGLIDTLGPGKRQPNLVFAAARLAGMAIGSGADLLAWLPAHWPAVAGIVASHGTQTNEARRCATLLPVLAALPQPLALLEVGAAAGLCLYPDRWSYQYDDSQVLHPAGGPGPAVLNCSTTGPVPIPGRLPDVVWRAGIDLHPLDVANTEDVTWLRTLVWPGQSERLAVLDAAIGLARADPPKLTGGDLINRLADMAAEAPTGATLVVFHSAVLNYLLPPARADFADAVRDLDAVWIANEAPAVLEPLGIHAPVGEAPSRAAFLLAQDGRALAWTGPHGQSLHWFG